MNQNKKLLSNFSQTLVNSHNYLTEIERFNGSTFIRANFFGADNTTNSTIEERIFSPVFNNNATNDYIPTDPLIDVSSTGISKVYVQYNILNLIDPADSFTVEYDFAFLNNSTLGTELVGTLQTNKIGTGEGTETFSIDLVSNGVDVVLNNLSTDNKTIRGYYEIFTSYIN